MIMTYYQDRGFEFNSKIEKKFLNRYFLKNLNKKNLNGYCLLIRIEILFQSREYNTNFTEN